MFNMTPDTIVQWTCNGWAPLPEANQKFNTHVSAIRPPLPPTVTNGLTRARAKSAGAKTEAIHPTAAAA